MAFGNPLGLWALALLVPFIIIYLRRPQIIERKLPSLMFLIKEFGMIRKYSFFRNLFTNLLFLLQLLILSLLAFSVSAPFVEKAYNASEKSTVLIIDTSASMQTQTDSGTRFEDAIELAKKELSGDISIITTGNSANLVLENGGQLAATQTLNSLKPSEGVANLEAAMHLAEQQLRGDKAKIVILSDFIKADPNDDPIKAKKILSTKGDFIKFIDVSNLADNVGFIDAQIGKEDSIAYIKNFNNKEKTITVKFIKNNVKINEVTRKMLPYSIETVKFQTEPGVSYLDLEPADDLSLDNRLWVSSPVRGKIKVMLISSDPNPFLKAALEASKYIELELKKPPFTLESIKAAKPDVIIVNEVNKNELVFGDFDGISKMVELDGIKVIVTVQEDMRDIDYGKLMIVDLIDLVDGSTLITKDIVNQFTKDVEFGSVSKHFNANAKESTKIASGVDGSTMISFSKLGQGKIVYYGILDDYSDFKATPGYPIFWTSLIDYLVESEDIKDYNKKIEERPLIDTQGIHNEEGKQMAVNLLNEKESNVNFDNEDFINEARELDAFEKTKVEKKEYENWMIAIAALLIFIEFIYIKYRGDL